MNRSESLRKLRSEQFDVCVIGGGATGAGCALDAQLRGLKTALIEKEDFAAETSSKSTKLVHGGVRYLEQAVKKLDIEQFRLVQKALKERKNLLDNAPYLAHPLALLTPCYTWFESWYYAIGLKIYDWIAGSTNLFPSRRLSKKETLKRLPSLSDKRLHSAVLYWDGQLDDTRYNFMLAKTASEAGAAVANHLQIIAFGKEETGKVTTATVTDRLSGELFSIRAKVFINATGPFSDSIRQMASPGRSPRMRVSKGAHIVLPRELMPGDTALLIPKTDDGRVIFAIPWLNQLLVGTTDTEAQLNRPDGQLNEPVLLEEEVNYLLSYLNRYLAVPVKPEQVQSGFAGVRPLLQANPDADTKELVRDHEVELDAASGLVSIMGGKWTTYRLMAQDTIDAVYALLQQSKVASGTAHFPLSGATDYVPEGWKSGLPIEEFPEAVCRHLWQKFGTNARLVIKLMREHLNWNEPLVEGYPHRKAEVIYAIRYEMACTLCDMMVRRLSLEVINWQASARAAQEVVNLMAKELGWIPERAESELLEYQKRISRYQLLATGQKERSTQTVN